MCNIVLLISNVNLKFLWIILSFMDNFIIVNFENNFRMLRFLIIYGDF